MSLIELKKKICIKDILSVTLVNRNGDQVVQVIIDNTDYKYYDKRISGDFEIRGYFVGTVDMLALEYLDDYNYLRMKHNQIDSSVENTNLEEDLKASLKQSGHITSCAKAKVKDVETIKVLNDGILIEEEVSKELADYIAKLTVSDTTKHMTENLKVQQYFNKSREYGTDRILIVSDNDKSNTTKLWEVTNSNILIRNSNDSLEVIKNRYGVIGKELSTKQLHQFISDTKNQLYYSHRGNILAYFGALPEGNMKYIVMELACKWYTFYEIHSDGSIIESPLATDTMKIGFLDHTWNPKDMIEFIDSNEDEYYMPDLSLELLVGRWEIESKENY